MSESIVALLKDNLVVFTEETRSCEVSAHHVLAVLSVLLPGVEVGAQLLKALALGFCSSISKLIEADLHVLVISKGFCSQLHTNLIVLFVLMVLPSLPG